MHGKDGTRRVGTAWVWGAVLAMGMVGGAGAILARHRPARWVWVVPALDPTRARLWECSFAVSRIPDGDTWAGSRMQRLDLGVVRAYWW